MKIGVFRHSSIRIKISFDLTLSSIKPHMFLHFYLNALFSIVYFSFILFFTIRSLFIFFLLLFDLLSLFFHGTFG